MKVVWTNSTHEFSLITVLLPKTSLWNSANMASMTLEVASTNSAHEFTLKSLLLSGKPLCNSVDMRSMTFEMAYTNSTHKFTPVTRVHPVNRLPKSFPSGVFWYNSTHEFLI